MKRGKSKKHSQQQKHRGRGNAGSRLISTPPVEIPKRQHTAIVETSAKALCPLPYRTSIAQIEQAKAADSAFSDMCRSLEGMQTAVDTIRGCQGFAEMVTAEQERADKLGSLLEESEERFRTQSTELESLKMQCTVFEKMLPRLKDDAERHKTKSVGEEKRSEWLTTTCSTLRQLNADHSKQIGSLTQKLGASSDKHNGLEQELQKAKTNAERHRAEVVRLNEGSIRDSKTIQALEREKEELLDRLDKFTRMSAYLHEEAKSFLDSKLAAALPSPRGRRRRSRASRIEQDSALDALANIASSRNGRKASGATRKKDRRRPRISYETDDSIPAERGRGEQGRAFSGCAGPVISSRVEPPPATPVALVRSGADEVDSEDFETDE